MTSSIRKFLLFNLLVSVAFTTALSSLANYFLYHQDLQSHMDAALTQSALVLESLLGPAPTAKSLHKTQQYMQSLPTYKRHLMNERYNSKLQFQVWTTDGKMLLHSPGSPRIPISDMVMGFTNQKINHENWRVFTTVDEKKSLILIVAELFNIRNELERKISSDYLYTLIITYPLLGLLIWFTVGRGLRSIVRVADEVAQRAPKHLKPVELHTIPEELQPLVDELDKLFLRLQQAFEREKRFAGDAAHELRTPLAALRTQTQVAINADSDEQRQKALQNILASVDRSAHVVEQLLTLSRMVPEAPIGNIERLDLEKLAAEVIAMLAPRALNKQIDIDLSASSQSPKIKGNATALSILLRNLIDNAIRYTPTKGLVHVSVQQVGRHVNLVIRDNGPGIPPELRSRVFERFFRVLGSKESGSGLGLPIVQQIADLHNAHIKLGSPKEGSGLVVTIQFPVIY